MVRKYPPSAYDQNLCLRLSLELWLIIAFLVRPYIVMLISIADRGERIGLIDMVYPDRMSLVLGGLIAVPAVLVVYAWRYGRELLLIATVLNAGVVMLPAVNRGVGRLGTSAWLQLAICGYILWELFRSARVKDVFSDWPAEGIGGG